MKQLGYMIFLIAYFQADLYKTKRENMVRSQIQNSGINNPLVLGAMRQVPRHLLVPENQQENAYEDRPLPIGGGQTISQPYIVGLMTDIIQPKKGMKVLEIGTGSGYQAAVLAEIVDQVYTIEIVESLGKRAKADLEKLGYDNVFVKIGDGYQGWPTEAPFDAILVTAAAEQIPQPLIDQLKEGGRMVIPVGQQGAVQELMLIERIKGKIKTTNLGAVRFVPFTRK